MCIHRRLLLVYAPIPPCTLVGIQVFESAHFLGIGRVKSEWKILTCLKAHEVVIQRGMPNSSENGVLLYFIGARARDKLRCLQALLVSTHYELCFWCRVRGSLFLVRGVDARDAASRNTHPHCFGAKPIIRL